MHRRRGNRSREDEPDHSEEAARGNRDDEHSEWVQIERGPEGDRLYDVLEQTVREEDDHELPIPLAAVGPVSALVLGAAGVLRDTTAIRLALGIGLATLAVQGVRYAGVEGFSRVGTIVAVAVNVSLGLVIVALEVGLAH